VPVIAAQFVVEPSVVKNLPALPVCVGNKALIAADAVVCPVPPLAMLNVPVNVIVPLDVTGPPVVVRPVVPPVTFTDVTVPKDDGLLIKSL
jgi:hypothetical protein